ncbi:MAG: B12-binding domain-containing radical SAM protein [Phyllobacteriaceae bacterium]|nr:B12-binding domain-containing radical SAM protein [Phyllobacteriaceae bacterium]
MRHVTFVRPALGEGPSADAMTPLVFAILRELTPPEIATTLIDERIEPFAPVPTDLVAMTVETFTARRAWEIADAYRARGVPVVVGGHHPSMVPEEAEAHADAVVIGDGEAVWGEILRDAANGRLKPRYEAAVGAGPRPAPDRSIFVGKRYAPVSLVQVGRGCRFACDFCSIHAFYGTHREQRPVAEVVAEIETLPSGRMIFFVDDNLLFRRDRFEALMRGLAPLKRRWSCQISIDVARDDRLLDLMAAAGCALVLIGFESLRRDNLKQMRKNWNGVAGAYDDVIARLRARGIMLYGTFVFGYDADRPEDFETTARFAEAMGMAIANFNPLTPMPGTGLIARLAEEGRLLRPTWWLDPAHRYGDAIFRPLGMSADELRDGPTAARAIFYGFRSIAARALRGLPRWGVVNTGLMLLANFVSRREIARKQAAPLAARKDPDPTGEGAPCGSP